jgi:hypothetical protein
MERRLVAFVVLSVIAISILVSKNMQLYVTNNTNNFASKFVYVPENSFISGGHIAEGQLFF